MCADIHDGREQNAPFKGPNTDEPDQLSPDRHFRLATHGRSIQMCHAPFGVRYGGFSRSPPLYEGDPRKTHVASYTRVANGGLDYIEHCDCTGVGITISFSQSSRWTCCG